VLEIGAENGCLKFATGDEGEGGMSLWSTGSSRPTAASHPCSAEDGDRLHLTTSIWLFVGGRRGSAFQLKIGFRAGGLTLRDS
jgi:hypothetical protein